MISEIENDIEKLIIECCERHPAFIENSKEDINNETILLGSKSILDSLGLIGLLIDIEEELSNRIDKPVQLLDEKALSEKNSPFRTVGSLSDFIIREYPE